MKITKSQLKQIIKEEIEKELDEGFGSFLKSAGQATKEFFANPCDSAPLGCKQRGTSKSRDLDEKAKAAYEDLRRAGNYEIYRWFRQVFLSLYGTSLKGAQRTQAQASRKMFGSSELWNKLRTLMRHRDLDIGNAAQYLKIDGGPWPGTVNPLEKKNYVIYPDTAAYLLRSDVYNYLDDLSPEDAQPDGTEEVQE